MFLKIIPFVEYLLYNYWKNTIINIFCIFFIYIFCFLIFFSLYWRVGFLFLVLYSYFLLFLPVLPPQYLFIHTHLLTLTHTYTHSLTHTHTHLHSHSHTHTHSLTLTHILTHTYSHSLTLTHIYSHLLTHIHLHTHSLTLTHTHIALPKGRMYVLASLGASPLLRGRRGIICTAKGLDVCLGVLWVFASFTWQAWDNVHCQGVWCTPWRPLGLRCFCVTGVRQCALLKGRMYVLASLGASPLLRGRRGIIYTAKGSDVCLGVLWVFASFTW